MPVVSPSKMLSVSFLEQTRIDNYVSAGGIEYCAEELDQLLASKYQKRADAQLDIWLNPSLEAVTNDGMIDILTEEQTKMGKKKMPVTNPMPGVRIVDDINLSSADMLRNGLNVDLMKPASEVARWKAEAETARAEFIGLRTEIFKAASSIEDFTAKIAELDAKLSHVAATASNGKIMAVDVDGCRNRLTGAASPYLARALVHAKTGLNTLLTGPSQCGKSTFAAQVAEALGLPIYRMVMGECLSDGAIWGRRNPVTGEFDAGPAHLAARDGGVLCVEEFDMGDANTIGQLNALFDDSPEVYCRTSNTIIKKHEKLVIIATANTSGRGADFVYTGRNRLDAATLKRFVPITMDYDRKLEAQLCPNAELLAIMHAARDKLTALKAKEFITTKDIKNAHVLNHNGVSIGDIIESLTLGWPQELIKQAFDDALAMADSIRKAKAADTKALPSIAAQQSSLVDSLV